MSYATIQTPGKFEGELEIVPEMWDAALDGSAQDVYVGGVAYSFVSLADIGKEPDGELYGACLYEREDGFVCATWYETEAEYETAREALEKQAADEADVDITSPEYDEDAVDVDAYKSAQDRVQELMRDFARWIYKGLEDNYESRMEDDYVDDAITINEYEFTADGTSFRG